MCSTLFLSFGEMLSATSVIWLCQGCKQVSCPTGWAMSPSLAGQHITGWPQWLSQNCLCGPSHSASYSSFKNLEMGKGSFAFCISEQKGYKLNVGDFYPTTWRKLPITRDNKPTIGSGESEQERKTRDDLIWLPGSNTAPDTIITTGLLNCTSQQNSLSVLSQV